MTKLLGKETIDTNSYGRTWGSRGSYTTNYQNSGRDLLAPDEVRMLDNRYGILFIRGEKPVVDLKYDLLKHPNIKLTPDHNQALVFTHGGAPRATAGLIPADAEGTSEWLTALDENGEYEALTETDIENQFIKEENCNEEIEQ